MPERLLSPGGNSLPILREILCFSAPSPMLQYTLCYNIGLNYPFSLIDTKIFALIYLNHIKKSLVNNFREKDINKLLISNLAYYMIMKSGLVFCHGL